MGSGIFQRFFIRQGGVGLVIKAGGSGLMPQRQNAAHGHVYRMARQFIVVPAIEQ